MPNILTTSNFTQEPIKIPNAVNESAGLDDNAGLDRVISENEKKLLREVLGADQYVTLQEELMKLPFNSQASVSADQTYIDLVNGKGVWAGLTPMLENFVFCAWLKTTEVTLTMLGAGKGKTDGFTVADNTGKYVERWNVFVDEYGDLLDFIAGSEDLEYEIADCGYEKLNSLGL